MITRNAYFDLWEHLFKDEITLIVGPRQAGKTTLMNLLKGELEEKGHRTVFLSLDFESDQPIFDSQQALIKRLQLEFGTGKGFVFLDEIQRKENAGLFLKGIYDMKTGHKFIVSGSGSLELKEKIHESLAGRKRIFEVGTLSFDEFLHYKTEYRYKGKVQDFFHSVPSRAQDLLEEYMLFGGYPRVVLEDSLAQKKAVMDELYRSYLERDIGYFLKVDKLQAFNALLKVLSEQIGQLVNYAELSSTVSTSSVTIQNYISYAEKTYVIHRMYPYYKNVRTEISKSPVVYFQDLGFRNFALGLWGVGLREKERGFVFQNFIFRLLKDNYGLDSTLLHFWRTKDKAEVDFIIEKDGGLIPVEVKYNHLKKNVLESSLKNFIKHYSPKEAWIINLSLREDVRFESTDIKVIPFYDLLKK